MILIAAGLSQPSFARISPFCNSRGTLLSEGDIAALTDATNHPLARPQLVTSSTEFWSNPQADCNCLRRRASRS